MQEFLIVTKERYTIDAFKAVVSKKYLDPANFMPKIETECGSYCSNSEIKPHHKHLLEKGSTVFIVKCSNYEILGTFRNMAEVSEIHTNPDAPVFMNQIEANTARRKAEKQGIEVKTSTRYK